MINYNKKFDKNGSVSYLLEDLSRGAKTKYKGGQHYEEEIFHNAEVRSPETYFHMCDRTCTCYADDGADRMGGHHFLHSYSSGWLALRNAKAYDDKNEIGKLYTGDTVDVTDSSGSTYWYVYASRLKKSGYVNRRYLANSSSERYVSVKSGYLALRNAKAFKSSNEVAELYTGDKVQIADASDSTYWLVYVPGLGKGGYVNKDYLVKNKDNTASAVVTKTVKVKSGYLALRNAKAYDDANEIGQLNTGDTVQVQDSSGSTYWYVYSSRLGKSGYVNKNYLQ